MLHEATQIERFAIAEGRLIGNGHRFYNSGDNERARLHYTAARVLRHKIQLMLGLLDREGFEHRNSREKNK
jgi:hypothetical protein